MNPEKKPWAAWQGGTRVLALQALFVEFAEAVEVRSAGRFRELAMCRVGGRGAEVITSVGRFVGGVWPRAGCVETSVAAGVEVEYVGAGPVVRGYPAGGFFCVEEPFVMTLAEYFENVQGLGILATADSAGGVDVDSNKDLVHFQVDDIRPLVGDKA